MPPVAGQHEIGVGLGGRILGIVEIEHGVALHEAAGDRGDLARSAAAPVSGAVADQLAEGEVQRDIAAGDRGGAGAAIGLQHVAIDLDLALAERRRDR